MTKRKSKRKTKPAETSKEQLLDKRTTKYKEWKEKFDEAAAKDGVGVGDIVEAITEATGIKSAVKAITKAAGFKSCGCDERKENLNQHRIFKQFKMECFTEDEYNYLADKFLPSKQVFTPQEQLTMKQIYERVYNVRLLTSCTSCSFITKVYKPLENYYNAFKSPENAE